MSRHYPEKTNPYCMYPNASKLIKKALTLLKDAGYQGTFIASYDGSGDSGSVEEADFNGVEIPEAGKSVIDFLESHNFSMDPGGVRSYSYNANGYIPNKKDDNKEYILSMIEEILPDGWEINEGSSGTVTLDIDSGKIHISHDENITETNHSDFEI